MAEPVVISDQQIRPFVGTLLGWFSIGGLVLALSTTVFISILSYAGFDAGEMGTMIGIFAAIGLLFLIPWLIIKLVLTIGIFKGKKWAVLLSLIFTVVGFFPALFSLGAGFFPFLVCITFLSLMLWTEIKCLKHPYYYTEAEKKYEG